MQYHGKRWPLALCLVALAGCATGPLVKPNHIQGDLRGMVYDLDRQPLADATISIAGGIKPEAVITDLHGRFGMGTVPFGPLTLRVVKAGYESLNWDFRFSEESQVLYLQLASSDQLLGRAAAALEKKEWREFYAYLDRAKILAPGSLQGLILSATASEQQGKGGEAVTLLETYPSEPPVLAVELYLGDLYAAQGKNDRAVLHWRKALVIKEDAEVRAKIEKVTR